MSTHRIGGYGGLAISIQEQRRRVQPGCRGEEVQHSPDAQLTKGAEIPAILAPENIMRLTHLVARLILHELSSFAT